MRLKVLNQFLLIEPAADLVPIDSDSRIEEIIKRGLIVIPEKNTALKLSPYAKIIKAGKSCKFKWEEGQRILYDQFLDQPFWFFDNGKRYRFITEWQILGTLDD